jgi:hypothetical protein
MSQANAAHSTRARDLSPVGGNRRSNLPALIDTQTHDLVAAAGLEARICHALMVLSQEAERINNKKVRLRARLDVLRALEASVELAERHLPIPTMVEGA